MDDQNARDRPERHKLRIAWSVVWCIICALLIVLWIRSYTYDERVSKITDGGEYLSVGTGYGTLAIIRMGEPATPALPSKWQIKRVLLSSKPGIGLSWLPIYQNFGDIKQTTVLIPLWMFAFAFCIFGAAPWVWRRFSLRTLLVSMTVVAALLGWAVWAGRK